MPFQMNYEPSPMQESRSKYEDTQTIARIGTAELSLVAKFDSWQKEILQNFYRLAGHIYSDADLAKLSLEKRPNFEWNLFLPIILSIVGNFKGQIPGLDFSGETPQDQQAADLQKKLSNYFLTQANDIEYELAKAFLWSVVGRIGWLKTSFSYQKDPEGMVSVEWYDGLRLKFDTNWTRRDTKDMRYMSDSGLYEASEIIDIYAKKDHSLRDEIYEKAMLVVGESAMKKGKMKRMLLTWAERFLNASLNYQGAKHGYNSFNDGDLKYNYGSDWYNGDGRFKVVDWFERRQQPIMTITDLTTGKNQDITNEVKMKDASSEKNWYDRDKLSYLMQSFQDPKVEEKWREVIWQTSVCPALNLVLYDDMQKCQSGNFKYIPILCYDFHPDILETKSVLDSIVDPVSSYNLRRNTILTYLMKSTQGGYIAEAGAVKGYEDDLMSNEIVSLKKVADGALANRRIIPNVPPGLPMGLAEEAAMEKADTETISGQSPNVQGRKESSKESGTLYAQRIGQASILMEWINDNAQHALIMIANNNLALAQTYLTMPRVISLIGDDADQEWLQLNVSILGKLMNDVSFGRFRIKTSKQPLGRKALEVESQKIMQFNTWLQGLDPSYVDPITALEVSGLSTRHKMIAYIKKAQQAKVEQAQAAQQKQEEDANMVRDLTKNNAKVDLLKKMNELHKGTLENQQLSDSIVSENIMNSLFN